MMNVSFLKFSLIHRISFLLFIRLALTLGHFDLEISDRRRKTRHCCFHHERPIQTIWATILLIYVFFWIGRTPYVKNSYEWSPPPCFSLAFWPKKLSYVWHYSEIADVNSMRLYDELIMPKARPFTCSQYSPHRSFQTGKCVFINTTE